ncbi:carboxypeptidase Q [Microplitis demolitor]|uniref:carboxypeptidase Q n=1 Tax=Microplitis demolitor TaxID=69319 RepID=UPI0004CD6791|nr:carboxypeptidase Q [Microplitis demolitor]
MEIINILIVISVSINYGVNCYIVERFDENNCAGVLAPEVRREIDNYQPIVNKIVNKAINGSFKGKTWMELSNFVDDFGSRFTGTDNLENAIDKIMERSRELGLENVHGDSAPVPRWIRGNESATLISPRKKNLKMLGLGYSIGTASQGITADAIVVESFQELKTRASEVPGKIVVYNQKFISYGKSVIYRGRGAVEAAKLGAVATLIRSVTPFSIYSPHTGMMSYEDGVRKIPAACITVEDANLLARFAKRGKNLRINVNMQAQRLPDVKSRNVISEITGSSKPEKAVIVSGHIDSWDVGQGAMDDGGGAFSSWASVVLLKSLNLRAKRTIRSIMWTAEEMGIIGANYYIKKYESDEKNLQMVMESDIGTFLPLGWEATGSPEVICILNQITKMMSWMTPLEVKTPHSGPDIETWVNHGVPGASLWNKNERYFWFHHSEGDTIDVEAPDNLDMATALFAATSYIIADINLDLPRNP